MNNQKLSLSEKLKIFLNEYYFGYGIFYSILRIISGPVILIMGLNLYFNGSTKLGISYSGIFVIFGIYYILRPLIILLTKKSWIKNFDFDYSINPEKIVITSGKSKSEVDYSEINKVIKRKTYYVLRTNAKQGIYLPIKNLESDEIEILNELKK